MHVVAKVVGLQLAVKKERREPGMVLDRDGLYEDKEPPLAVAELRTQSAAQ